MAIRFRDFPPDETDRHWLAGPSYAPLKESVERANEWIAAKGASVLNVETVLIPNLGDGSPGETKRVTGEWITWIQVVRVWYIVEG